MQPFAQALRSRPQLFDGGLGTELLRLDAEMGDPDPTGPKQAGAPGPEPGAAPALPPTPLEAWVLERPAILRRAHAAWVDAGARVLSTCTFLANALDLGELAGRTHELNQRAAELARESGAPYVLGVLGPGLQLTRELGVDARRRSYAAQVEGLLAGGVDGLLIETCTELEQIRAALAAVRDVDPARSTWLGVSFSPRADLTLHGGVELRRAAAELAPEVDLLGVNCCAGPRGLQAALDELLRTGRPLALYPNAGLPGPEALDPEPFAVEVARLAAAYDVALAGGCCGAGPAHIAALGARWPGADVL